MPHLPPPPPPPPPPPDDFATELKRARLAAGLSQAELGDLAGLTGSYLSLLESRRKPPPREDLVAALAKTLRIDERRLQELAAMERTPEPVRQRVIRLVEDRIRRRRSRDRLLTTSLFHMTRRPGFLPDYVADMLGLPEDHRILLGQLTRRVRDVPDARSAERKSNDLLKEVSGRQRDELLRVLPRLLDTSLPAHPATAPSAPIGNAAADDRPWRRVLVFATPPPGDPSASARHALDSIHVDRRLFRPGCWFLVADDDEAYPRVEKGDLLLVMPAAPLEEGALVAVRDGGRVRIRILHRREGEVRLDSPRSEVPPLRLPEGRFSPLGTVTWILRPLAGMPAARRREGESEATTA